MDQAAVAGRSQGDRIVIFRELLGLMPPGRLLDLATGHGAFAEAARDLGWTVTAVDARTTRMPMSDGIEWMQADVREFPTDGYDVITMFGLFYHLELDAQMALLRRCSPTLTLIDTHISTSPRTMIDGYLGHLFKEVQEDPRASWGNPLSFWPTEESLGRMLLSCGYSSIHKILPAPVTPDRTFYIASPDGPEPVDSLADQFSEASEYTLERFMTGVTLSSSDGSSALDDDVSTLRRERDVAVAELSRLKDRSSVKIALRAAALAKPAYRLLQEKDRVTEEPS